VDVIGRRGRRLGTALCTGSRGQAGGVGGWLVHTILGRVQTHDGENSAQRGGYGAPEGWAGVAS
jgi:hypothetical protein